MSTSHEAFQQECSPFTHKRPRQNGIPKACRTILKPFELSGGCSAPSRGFQTMKRDSLESLLAQLALIQYWDLSYMSSPQHDSIDDDSFLIRQIYRSEICEQLTVEIVRHGCSTLSKHQAFGGHSTFAKHRKLLGGKVGENVGSVVSAPRPVAASGGCLLAHDMNNKLTVILGNCEILSETVAEESDFGRALKQISGSARSMADRLCTHQCHLASRP